VHSNVFKNLDIGRLSQRKNDSRAISKCLAKAWQAQKTSAFPRIVGADLPGKGLGAVSFDDIYL
jgi:hypothetical protein